MEKLAQSGGGTIHVSVKILFACYYEQSSSQESIAGFGHTVHAALRLSARSEKAKAFGVAVCRHVVAENQPLVVTDLARDPRFAESPFPKATSISLLRRSAAALVPARLAFRAAFSA